MNLNELLVLYSSFIRAGAISHLYRCWFIAVSLNWFLNAVLKFGPAISQTLSIHESMESESSANFSASFWRSSERGLLKFLKSIQPLPTPKSPRKLVYISSCQKTLHTWWFRTRSHLAKSYWYTQRLDTNRYTDLIFIQQDRRITTTDRQDKSPGLSWRNLSWSALKLAMY